MAGVVIWFSASAVGLRKVKFEGGSIAIVFSSFCSNENFSVAVVVTCNYLLSDLDGACRAYRCL